MKQALKVLIVLAMAGLFALISINAFSDILELRQDDFSTYFGQCMGAWIKSIILSQAVFFSGGLFLYMLREKKKKKKTTAETVSTPAPNNDNDTPPAIPEKIATAML